MIGFELLVAAAASLVGLGLAETIGHRRRLSRVPTRIHVSGTRGKSSVTRLLTAGMRSGGVRTCGKTTGTLPRMILPDGREVPIFRPSGANVIEQVRIVQAAHSVGAEALVMECMALIPELHWIAENKLVRATHGVITNIRADHLDVMGPTERDVGLAIAGMVPVGGVLITAERRHLDILRYACDDRKTRLVTVTDEDLAAVTDAELSRFSHVEHRDNVALTLKVLEEIGVDRSAALEGMWQATPDPGALTDVEVDFFGRRLIFVNAFAANDPWSTERIWEMATSRHPNVDRTVALFNLRADRPSRTLQLARDSVFWHAADRVILMGTGVYLFSRVADRAGFDTSRLVYADNQSVEEIFEAIVSNCGRRTLIVGMANIGGQGLRLVRHFHNRSVLEPEN
jgi:poly-gamma-glutamate synthase PgsB/CapB